MTARLDGDYRGYRAKVAHLRATRPTPGLYWARMDGDELIVVEVADNGWVWEIGSDMQIGDANQPFDWSRLVAPCLPPISETIAADCVSLGREPPCIQPQEAHAVGEDRLTKDEAELIMLCVNVAWAEGKIDDGDAARLKAAVARVVAP